MTATSFFQALTNPHSVAAILMFLLPGFVAFKIDQQLRPQAVRNAVDAILEIGAYSIVNDLLWSPVYLFGNQTGFPASLNSWVASVVVLVISPAVLTWGYARLVDLAANNAWIPSPVARPWDHFFQRVVKQQQARAVGVILTLRDGRRIGGVYKKPGFASSFPTDEQLLLGETWLLDREGAFTERVAGSLGLLVDKDDILTLEFFEWPQLEKGVECQN